MSCFCSSIQFHVSQTTSLFFPAPKLPDRACGPRGRLSSTGGSSFRIRKASTGDKPSVERRGDTGRAKRLRLIAGGIKGRRGEESVFPEQIVWSSCIRNRPATTDTCTHTHTHTHTRWLANVHRRLWRCKRLGLPARAAPRRRNRQQAGPEARPRCRAAAARTLAPTSHRSAAVDPAADVQAATPRSSEDGRRLLAYIEGRAAATTAASSGLLRTAVHSV